MTQKEQKTFVKNLTDSVRLEIISKIEGGRIPENWDGHELRQLISDKFERETTLKTSNKSRFKEYENEVIVKNL